MKTLMTTAAAIVLATTPLAAAQTEQEGLDNGLALTVVYFLKCDAKAFTPTTQRYMGTYIDAHADGVSKAGVAIVKYMETVEQKVGKTAAWLSWCVKMKPSMEAFDQALRN